MDKIRVERLQDRIKQRDFKLKALLEVTNAINENRSTEELLQEYRNIVEHELQIRRLVLFSKVDDIWTCSVQYGVDTDYRTINVENSFVGIRDIKLLQGTEAIPGLDPFDLLIPVFHKERPLSYLLIGDIDEEEIRVSPIIKHMRFIQTLTNIISVAIENKRLLKRSLEQERVNTELKLAAEMQALMVGSGVRDYPAYEVATYYRPHQEIGGDFCDFIQLSEDEAFFCMADVSGKGVSAAFLMANIQAHLKALLEHTNWSLESLVQNLNKKIIETVRGDRFVTLFMGFYHAPSRMLHYINAGHNPPFVISNNEIHFLENGTVGIGMLDSLPFVNKGELKIGRNSLLVLFTDGVIELEDENEVEFGNERLSQLVKEKQPLIEHIDDVISHIVNALDNHRGSRPYFDDTALLCCKFK